MQSAQHITQRPFLFFLPLLLCQFLSVALSSCGPSFQCEAIPRPSVIPHLFIANGRVYLSSEGTGLRVFQESSGKQLWQASGQLAAIDGDQIYLDISDDNPPLLKALRANDGKLLWQKTEDASSRVTSATHGSVYLYQRTNGMLVALNGRDGTERWENHVGLPYPRGDEDGISVQVSSSVVYVLSIRGRLSAYQEENGALLWSSLFPSFFRPEIPWQISEGVIYLTDTTHVYALRTSDGTVLWQTSANAFVLDHPRGIVLALVSAASGPSLVALQALDGKVLWQRSEPQIQLNLYGADGIGLKLIGGTVYIGIWSDAGLPIGMRATYFATDVSAIRASDGMYLWLYQGEKSWDNLAVEGTETTAYILSSKFPEVMPTALLTAFRVSDGKHLWQHAAPAAGLTLVDGVLYAGYGGDDQTSGCYATGAAHIIKYRAADGQELWHVQS